MPEENNELKCDCCEDSVADMEVHSNEEFAVICELCYENEFYCCDDCGNTIYEGNDPGNTGVHDEIFCLSCTNENYRCISCENVLIPRLHDYYEHPHDYDRCCNGCAEHTAMCYCQECDADIYYNEAHEEHAQEGYCYDCYNRTRRSIEHQVDSRINISKVLLSNHYETASNDVKDFFRLFYGYSGDDYDHQKIMLPKSGGGYGNGFGYYNSYVRVASRSLKKMKEYIYSLLKSRMFVCDHRKYGLYNPVHDLFRECFKFYDNKTGEYIEGHSVDLQQLGRDWSRFSISAIDSHQIYIKLKRDIETNGNLRQTLIKAFNGSAKNRLAAIFDEHHSFWNDYESYKTNSAAVKLPIKIGFDPADLQKILNHNARVSSCQVEGNNESYGFGMMDIVTNPHLLALVYDTDGKTIIGRSVIRLFKEQDNEDSKTYIAPSRLYLSNYTHAKTELYNELFVAVDEWGKKNFGEDMSQLVASTSSLHDTPPSDFINTNRFIKKPTSANSEELLVTQWWHTWFREKPDNSEAKFQYYQDENLGIRCAEINGNTTRYGQFALREDLRYRQYTQLEVKDENEQ
tara:strand:- start:2742 stop:4457 length:1716 start_codon:yes stop_codon:yes gene_type:complete